MKKLIGYIGAYAFYYMGDAACKLIALKVNGQYIFDEDGLNCIGSLLAEAYQLTMKWSMDFQDWAGNEKPWTSVQNKTNEQEEKK